jgi:hypothetical protein
MHLQYEEAVLLYDRKTLGQEHQGNGEEKIATIKRESTKLTPTCNQQVLFCFTILLVHAAQHRLLLLKRKVREYAAFLISLVTASGALHSNSDAGRKNFPAR